jgi:hypothetical protein
MLSRVNAELALSDLVIEIEKRNHRSSIYIVGGAALMLGYGARDATKDIDAAMTPRNEIMEVASGIARRRNLTDD